MTAALVCVDRNVIGWTALFTCTVVWVAVIYALVGLACMGLFLTVCINGKPISQGAALSREMGEVRRQAEQAAKARAEPKIEQKEVQVQPVMAGLGEEYVGSESVKEEVKDVKVNQVQFV
eukprot:TRINITY_DN121126_c1_g1_i1.p5 TRINITY_DN121126_c1_g1~~TRINITY_DN121126_c1_g1_i1.p5  ORF type:complete len:120 (+),score=15.60 TRINITY_DN121126_c1_g1_i1:511-870(+)